MNRLRALNAVLYALSGAIVIASLVVSYLFIAPVDVLKDWQIILPDNELHVGEEVVLQSQYTKLKPVKGTAVRYVECENDRGIFIRYPLNEATADRAPGLGGTGIVVKLPETVPDLPARCKFSIVIVYRVYPFRDVTEFVSSKEFTLYQ